jgi:hypothetical protein
MSEEGRYIASFYVTFQETGAVKIWIPKWTHRNPKKEIRKSIEGIIRKCIGQIPIDTRRKIFTEIKTGIEYVYGRFERCHDDHDLSWVIFQIYSRCVFTLGGDCGKECSNTGRELLRYAGTLWQRKKTGV